jgi:predicted  nucleic acid-binding Zn-ribbon protein
MTGSLKNIIIIVLLSIVAIIGIYNIVDLRAAYHTTLEKFQEERDADTVKHAKMILEQQLQKLQSAIEDYEKQLNVKQVNLSVMQSSLDKNQELYSKRQSIQDDFARRILVSSDGSVNYYGKQYTPDEAASQLKQYIAELQAMQLPLLQEERRVNELATQIAGLDSSIQVLKQQKFEKEMEINQVLVAKEMSEIERLSIELTTTGSGAQDSSSISKTTNEIDRILGLLEVEIARNTVSSQSGSTSNVKKDSGLLGFDDTEALQNQHARDIAVEEEYARLLGLNATDASATTP